MKAEKVKKIILMITGPGILVLEAVALFVHLFSSINMKPWLIVGLVIFFIGFIPLYSIEYFRQEFRKEDKGRIRFQHQNKRTDWHGGNIHGKVPTKTERPGKLFRDGNNI